MKLFLFVDFTELLDFHGFYTSSLRGTMQPPIEPEAHEVAAEFPLADFDFKLEGKEVVITRKAFV